MWALDKQTQTHGVFETHQPNRCDSPALSITSPRPSVLSLFYVVSDQLFAEGVSTLPLPATHVRNPQQTTQNSKTRIKPPRIHDDTMYSPVGSSRTSGLCPQHMNPPTVEQAFPGSSIVIQILPPNALRVMGHPMRLNYTHPPYLMS